MLVDALVTKPLACSGSWQVSLPGRLAADAQSVGDLRPVDTKASESSDLGVDGYCRGFASGYKISEVYQFRCHDGVSRSVAFLPAATRTSPCGDYGRLLR